MTLLSDRQILKYCVLCAPLECAKGMHLYAGRCFTQCPGGTYPSEVLTELTSSRRNLTYLPEGPKSLIKRHPVGKAQASEAADMELANQSPKICLPCHYSCTTCFGPENYHCLSCPGDAQIVNSTDVVLKLYCYPVVVLPAIDDANWHYRLNIGLSIVIFIVSCISLYCLVASIFKRYGVCYCSNYNSNVSMEYKQLAADDKIGLELEKALQDSSDSDDDLNL